jgi:hypothetical protein
VVEIACLAATMVLQGAITAAIMFRRVVGLYTLANALWPVGEVANVFGKMNLVWKWFHFS